ELEVAARDVNAFAALARSPTHAATLSQATEGRLDRSRRHREIRRPAGFGDELRVTMTEDGTTWGALTLLRTADRPDFTPADARLIASASPLLAEGMRRALLTPGEWARLGAEESVGLLVLTPENAIVQANGAARHFLSELPF